MIKLPNCLMLILKTTFKCFLKINISRTIINKQNDITGTLMDETDIPITNKTVGLYVNEQKKALH